jgi:hypothetical protein
LWIHNQYCSMLLGLQSDPKEWARRLQTYLAVEHSKNKCPPFSFSVQKAHALLPFHLRLVKLALGWLDPIQSANQLTQQVPKSCLLPVTFSTSKQTYALAVTSHGQMVTPSKNLKSLANEMCNRISQHYIALEKLILSYCSARARKVLNARISRSNSIRFSRTLSDDLYKWNGENYARD